MAERDERYVLVGGVHSGGRSRRVVAAFGCESEARTAFRELRLQAKDDQDWADLVAVGNAGKLRRVCWFGSATAGAAPAVRTVPAVRGRRWLWPLRRLRQP